MLVSPWSYRPCPGVLEVGGRQRARGPAEALYCACSRQRRPSARRGRRSSTRDASYPVHPAALLPHPGLRRLPRRRAAAARGDPVRVAPGGAARGAERAGRLPDGAAHPRGPQSRGPADRDGAQHASVPGPQGRGAACGLRQSPRGAPGHGDLHARPGERPAGTPAPVRARRARAPPVRDPARAASRRRGQRGRGGGVRAARRAGPPDPGRGQCQRGAGGRGPAADGGPVPALPGLAGRRPGAARGGPGGSLPFPHRAPPRAARPRHPPVGRRRALHPHPRARSPGPGDPRGAPRLAAYPSAGARGREEVVPAPRLPRVEDAPDGPARGRRAAGRAGPRAAHRGAARGHRHPPQQRPAPAEAHRGPARLQPHARSAQRRGAPGAGAPGPARPLGRDRPPGGGARPGTALPPERRPHHRAGGPGAAACTPRQPGLECGQVLAPRGEDRHPGGRGHRRRRPGGPRRGAGHPAGGPPPGLRRLLPGPQPAGGPVQGTGLGLAIARECAIAHGGEIRIIDGLAPGTHFRVTLPSALVTARAP